MGPRKTISFAFCLLLTCSALPMALEAGVPAPPPIAPGTVVYIDGNWNVASAMAYADQTIVLTGDLVIQAGGSLSLANVTLRMNCTLDGQYGIDVQAGGALFMNDTDRNPVTTADSSRIMVGLTPGRGYTFNLSAGAVFEARNSRIEGCGLLAGGTGAGTSGLQIRSSSAFLENTSVSGCANGIIADSCIVTVLNGTVSGCIYNGIKITDAASPGATCGVMLNGTAVSGNMGDGILAQASNIDVAVTGGSISDNYAGIVMNCGAAMTLGVSGCSVSLNSPGGGIWLDGTPGVGEISADIADCTISDNDETALRLGFTGESVYETPVKTVSVNLTGSQATSGDSLTIGAFYALATESIYANLTGNDIIMPGIKYGLHIGRVMDTLNIHPAPDRVNVQLWNNNISLAGGGVLRACATGNQTVNMVGNRIFNYQQAISCGAVSIGWFSSGWDDTTPENMTLVMKQNTFNDIAEDGAIGIKAIYNIWADISDNSINGAIGGGLTLGWLDEGDANTKYASELWSKPTRNVRARIYQNIISGGSGASILVYSSNQTDVFGNLLMDKESGDGIRLLGSSRPAKVHANQINTHEAGIGVKLEETSNASVYGNTISYNMYGIGLERGSHDNAIFNNAIVKSAAQYGFYFNVNSLDNAMPANNTVNGTSLSKFHDLHGSAGALIPISGLAVDRPKMSNLGQIIISNSTFLDICGNQASNGVAGLALYNVQSSVVENNTFTSGLVGQGYGISLAASSGNLVRGNTITDNIAGLAIMPYSSGNTLWQNGISKYKDSDIGLYVDPNGSAFANEISDNNTVDGTPVLYYYDDPELSVEGLDITVCNITNLGQVFAYQCDSVTVANSSIGWGASGISISGAKTAIMSNVTVNGASSTAIRIGQADDVAILGSSLRSTGTGISAYSVAAMSLEDTNILGLSVGARLDAARGAFGNCSLEGATLASLSSASTLSLINTTHTGGPAVVSADSVLEAKWYMEVDVVASGMPLEGALVNVTDSKGVMALNVTSDANGKVPDMLLLEWAQAGMAYDNRTPYFLNVTKDGYSKFSEILDLNRSYTIIANLSDIMAPELSAFTIAPSSEMCTSNNILWLNASVEDTMSGNNAVAGAEFIIAAWSAGQTQPGPTSGPATQMEALDGAFDSPSERVTAEVDVSGLPKGCHAVWVRAGDSKDNWCPWMLKLLNVTDDQAPVITIILQSSPANLSAGSIWFNSTATDAQTGNSNIIGIEWAVSSSNGTLVSGGAITRPLDGSFNEPVEETSVKVALTTLAIGESGFRIRPTDSAGLVGDWAEVVFDVVDDVAPTAPKGLVVANTTEHGELSLSWAMNTEQDLASYSVYRSSEPGTGFARVATVGGNMTHWTDTGLSNDTIYYYRLSALDAAAVPNESPLSAEASARTIPASTDTAPSDSQPSLSPMLVVGIAASVAAALIVAIMLIRRRKAGLGE